MKRSGPCILIFAILLCGLLISTVGCNGITSSPPVGRNFNNGKGFSTIVLGIFYNPGGKNRAIALQRRATVLLGENDVWLENYPQNTTVYLGHYTTHQKATKKCKAIQRKYGKLRTGMPFCYVKDITPPAPLAPKQWNLLNSNCAYSIEVGRYYNSEGFKNRKKNAVDAVRILRKNNVPAFFVHGQTESRIYVGCFSFQDVVPAKKGDAIVPTYSPAIQQMKKQYPHLGENGQKVNRVFTNPRTGEKKKIPIKSKIIKVDFIRMEIVF